MNKFRFTVKLLVTATFLLAFASLAQAQATRTWVSGVGDDVNPCSRTAPCKTWAGAISKTAAGGEIDALDPGGYGTLNITKSITIEGTDGQGFGSTLNSATNGFIVNGSGIIVALRNLSINGAGTTQGQNGVRIILAGRVLIEGCQIFNQGTGTAGIDISLTATSTNVTVRDCTIYNSIRGIRATSTSGVVALSVERTSIHTNTNEGIRLENGGFVTVQNSTINLNATGVTTTVANSGANLINTDIVANTGTGLAAGSSLNCRVGGSTFIGNGTGITQAAGNNVKTFGDNYIADTVSPAGLQLINPS